MLRVHIKSIKIRIWGIFCIRMVLISFMSPPPSCFDRGVSCRATAYFSFHIVIIEIEMLGFENISFISRVMLQNGTQMVRRMYIKSIKLRIWGIFEIKMVFGGISDTIFDHFKQLFRAINSEMVPNWCLECI